MHAKLAQLHVVVVELQTGQSVSTSIKSLCYSVGRNFNLA